MARLTYAQAYAYARQAGFDANSAATIVAIAMGESGLVTNKLGDVQLETAYWGPSVGLTQVRSIKGKTGTGDVRDVSKLSDPAFNMSAAYKISSGGKDFTPWTVYNTGKWRDFLPQAQAAAGQASGLITNTGTVVDASWTNPLGTQQDWTRLGLQFLAIGAGAILVIAGGYVAIGSPKPPKALMAAVAL